MKNTFVLLLSIIFFSNGFSKEEIYFLSANPFSFKDIIKNLDNLEEQEVFGTLKLPSNALENEKFPLIIGVAGSFGWGSHHFEYLEMYREMGIATFELNSFKSRGVKSTVGTQTEVTTAMMILDVYRAFEILSNHPNINKNKVGLTGWSLGGAVTLFSGWKPLKNAINKELQFSAKLPFYPPFFVIPDPMDFEDTPTHILIGELDTWTPAEACIEFEEMMKEKSYNFNLTVYENSYHSFDRESDVSIRENAYDFSDCRLRMNDQGVVFQNFNNIYIPMSTPLLQKIGLALCAKRGPKFGGNPQARKKSFQFSKHFMNQYLLLD